jgi:methylenetetrahydrofolate--tRNA-(uracil-5-)-methyltransferase
MNVNFGLFPPLPERLPKRQRGAAYAERALEDLAAWVQEIGERG